MKTATSRFLTAGNGSGKQNTFFRFMHVNLHPKKDDLVQLYGTTLSQFNQLNVRLACSRAVKENGIALATPC